MEFCERVPAAKPGLKKWGMRTSQEWFAHRVIRVQLTEGKSLKLTGISENYLTFDLFWRGASYYEPLSTGLARELVRGGATFFDVGANIGFYSLVLSAWQPSLNVVAFEPNPKAFRLLQKNVLLNQFARVVCEPMAVSDEEGSAMLHLCASDMSASLESDFERRSGGVRVATTTLDGYLARHPVSRNLLIKVDVEGHEAAFFRGALETLKNRRPDILCEITGRPEEAVTEFVRRAGYSFYQVTEAGLLPSEDLTLNVRGPFLFLNYLLSTRPEVEITQLSRVIQRRASEINLRETSKFVAPEMIERLNARQTAVRSGEA
jgi:FkbM family methyltransferase